MGPAGEKRQLEGLYHHQNPAGCSKTTSFDTPNMLVVVERLPQTYSK